MYEKTDKVIMVIDMVKKVIIPILLALLTGFLLGTFLFKQYNKEDLQVVGKTKDEIKEVYFLQIGVYSSKESMEENVSKIPYYIYQVDNGKYYVYVGMTLKEANATKLKDFFIASGYNIYVKKFGISNVAFLTVLEQYDTMLEQAPDANSYSAICGQVLAKYEELVNSERDDQGTA